MDDNDEYIKVGYGLQRKSEVFDEMKKALSRLQSKVATLENQNSMPVLVTAVQSPKPVPEFTEKVSRVCKAPSKSAQRMVDAHLRDYEELKELEKRMAVRKERIVEYMQDHGFTTIKGQGGYVEFKDSERARVTSRYTKYDYTSTVQDLPLWAERQCVKKVIDGEVLEDLVKRKRLPRRVLRHMDTRIHTALYTRCQ